ncbi:hypothetical protein TU94_00070 [Streptomyces cyaneogriseus subsp. noncyanogenus]|uniref:Uncharacterized protein n=1 Tax=Streptomyces cyaneogriseus subsp. noncyanogenus TaxID=477245 RepID=A0A0C5FRA9_9ACTN|nr:hypothetical protein [Streptomyces cyaneogriseus]AJP00198.1 hypothetical protein TU94_00070 [Streptomyces cyaneogriseus subsp. noncyanogenus]
MSLLTTLQQARAAQTQYAQPLSRLRYLHVADQPMLILPLNRPGETARPLAVMAGSDPSSPQLFLAPPGDDDRFLAVLAEHLHAYIHSFQHATRIRPAKGEQPERREYLDAPQLVVTGTASVYYLKTLGRALRYRPIPEGTDPATSVSHLGRWLTFFTERAEYASSSLLLNLTSLLSTHWATGQSALEDAHLAPLMAWIFPPHGRTGHQAALTVENPLQHPPDGPTIDPSFETAQLTSLFADLKSARGSRREHHVTRLREALESYLTPTWNLAWEALSTLRGMPPIPSTTTRWDTDIRRFTAHSDHLDAGGPPQPKQDDAVTAAVRLAELEHAAASLEAARALEDTFVMAERRTTGEAFSGTVTHTEPDRKIKPQGPRQRAKRRPLLTVRTTDPVRLEPNRLLAGPHDPAVHMAVCDITYTSDATEIVLEVRTRVSSPHSVPAVGTTLLLTTAPDHFRRPQFPGRDQIPWTHTGPVLGAPKEEQA